MTGPEFQKTRLRFPNSSVTLGICASDFAPSLPELLEVILSERLPEGVHLDKIIIVASGCPKWVLGYVERLGRMDHRIMLVEEAERRGKAEALNKIISLCRGDYVLFVNSDALPQRGALSKLIHTMAEGGDIGVVSACPVLESFGESTTAFKTEELMWKIHNESSLVLNHLGMSNHSSDEMMLVRSSALTHLPDGLVNDGAYIAGVAKLHGYSIRFCEDAKVRIDVPSRLRDLVGQRRRIIWGHMQVTRFTGRSPKTLRVLFLSHPLLSLSIALKTVRKSPRLLLVLPIALFCESASSILATYDVLVGKDHGVWKRYGN